MTIQQFAAKVDRLTDANKWRAAHQSTPNVNARYEQSFSSLERVALRSPTVSAPTNISRVRTS